MESVRVLRGSVEVAGRGVTWLLGVPHAPKTILSSVRCLQFDVKSDEPEYGVEAEELRVLLPRGLDVLGVLLIIEEKQPENITRAGDITLKLRGRLWPGTNTHRGAIAAVAQLGGKNETVQYSWYDGSSSSNLQALGVEIFDDGAWNDITLLRCQMQLSMPLYFVSSVEAPAFQEQALKAIENIIAQLKSGNPTFLVEGPGGAVLLGTSFQAGSNGQQQSPVCSSLSAPQTFTTPGGYQIPMPVNVKVLGDSAIAKDSGLLMQNLSARSPVFVQLLKLNVDVLCMAPSHMSAVEAATSLVTPALCDQLTTMCNMVKKNTLLNSKISAFHFCPLRFPITAILDLSYGETEMALVNKRKALHQRLGLPLDRPMLRVANALTSMNVESVVDASLGWKRLRDVHIGLPSSGVVGGTQSLVDGSYEYFHYLQDRIDDNGWGCAYRSLQTIISWFRLQHYTSVAVPTHREIQETLVEIGDKDASFIGSQGWIGAIELSFVLDKLLGISCKVLDVRSGADLPGKCRELALHFNTQGTPIMIGGGVLAYTLLGIDYNELTGESAFLILDPHYTGGEDLKSICSGGWCGWKRAVGVNGKEFFLAHKFYNLLLPQRPNTV